MKKNLVAILFIAFVTIWSGCTKSEKSGTLYGYVTDSRTGLPVKEAVVELSSTSLKTTTETDGLYQFSEVKSGEYEISITKTGYPAMAKKGILIEDGPVRCDVQLASLPSFEYNGHTYMVAPKAEELMSLADAISYCQELTLYGFSDWKLPTIDELEQMYINKDVIGGFPDKVHWSSTYSSTNSYSADLYFVLHFLNGNVMEARYSSMLHVRPIRIDKYKH